MTDKTMILWKGDGALDAAADAVAGGAAGATVNVAPSDAGASVDAVLTVWGRAEDVLRRPGVVGAYLVDEVVQRDYERTWRDGAPSPGLNLVCLVRRAPFLTHEQFSEHWRDVHGPLALRLQPGFWRYVQNHVVEAVVAASPDYDGIGELHFRTAEEVVTGMFDGPEGRQRIIEDTDRFLALDRSETVGMVEHVLRGAHA